MRGAEEAEEAAEEAEAAEAEAAEAEAEAMREDLEAEIASWQLEGGGVAAEASWLRVRVKARLRLSEPRVKA